MEEGGRRRGGHSVNSCNTPFHGGAVQCNDRNDLIYSSQAGGRAFRRDCLLPAGAPKLLPAYVVRSLPWSSEGASAAVAGPFVKSFELDEIDCQATDDAVITPAAIDGEGCRAFTYCLASASLPAPPPN